MLSKAPLPLKRGWGEATWREATSLKFFMRIYFENPIFKPAACPFFTLTTYLTAEPNAGVSSSLNTLATRTS